MGDENPIRSLGDYSKPSHEGYRNTTDTIRLVQNGCSFYGLWSEDPNQHLKDFLKLVDSLDLNGENRERTISIRSMDSFQGLTCEIDRSFFYDHVSVHFKCEIDRAAGGKLRNKNADESWEIIKNLRPL
ncbi:hypothetical protein Tco_0220687 [Tanacetum coccineum]